MNEIEKYVNDLKKTLKENLTSDNLELSQKIDNSLDNILAENKKQEEKLIKANETLLNVVKQTSFKVSESENPLDQEETPKTIDEALNEAINKVVSERQK